MINPIKPAVRYRLRTADTVLHLPPGRTYRFPKEFVWGAATSSHQTEGMNERSDWWSYERSPDAVQNFFNFPKFAQDYKSDHWRRFPDDIAMMKEQLGLTGYRFSLEWSRIEPEEGKFDWEIINRYAELCAQMRANNISPLVTLFHWCSPAWIWDNNQSNTSGWYSSRIVERFRRFCQAVVPALAPHVNLFATLNEPNVFLYGSYSEGILAPGHQVPDVALINIQRNLLRCHMAAWNVIKTSKPSAQVGIAHHFCRFEPERNWNPLECRMAARVEQSFTWAFPDAIRNGFFRFGTRSGRPHIEEIDGLQGSADFIGVNFYERMFVRVPAIVKIRNVQVVHEHRDSSDLWPSRINTVAFSDFLRIVHERYRLPIYITENGQSHPDDSQRSQFILQHLCTLGHAMSENGVDVRGYFYWSLLDNQEWAKGFAPRLGLYHVDYSNGNRSLRDSGRFYAEIIAKGAALT